MEVRKGSNIQTKHGQQTAKSKTLSKNTFNKTVNRYTKILNYITIVIIILLNGLNLPIKR
jgi:preprotein translocase subunit SecG